MVEAVYSQMNKQEDFYNFRNKSLPESYLQDMFGSWLMDNCEPSDFNKQRPTWAIIGEDNEILQRVKQDI